MINKRSINRGISLKTFKFNNIEKGSGQLIKQNIDLQVGISKDNAKKINKLIKEKKLKVQTQIQNDQIRVVGKKIDDLQELITLLKNTKIEIPIQFINMKKQQYKNFMKWKKIIKKSLKPMLKCW